MLLNTLLHLALALAAPLHQHHEHKREIVTVYTTVNVPLVPTGIVVPVDTIETPVHTESLPSHTDSPSSGDESAVGSSGAKGVTYSPYSPNGCKSPAQVASDLAQLSGFDIIRLYGVDCNQVENVLAAKKSNQKIFAGIFDVHQITSGVQAIDSAIKSTPGASWNDIDTVSVGNELVNNGQATPAQIKSYTQEARTALAKTDYTGPVVSVDTFIATINNPELCDASDYIAINAHAFFDGHIAAENSGKWVLQQIQIVSTVCPGKRVLVTETGWPSRGESNGIAVPSKSNQNVAIDSIKETCGSAAILFTAFDDLWKDDGPFAAEKFWGFLSN